MKMRKYKKEIQENKQEEQILMNPKNFYNKKGKINKKKFNNKYIIVILIFLLIIIFIFFILILVKILRKANLWEFNFHFGLSYINGKEEPSFSKYKDMLPRLSPDSNAYPPQKR